MMQQMLDLPYHPSLYSSSLILPLSLHVCKRTLLPDLSDLNICLPDTSLYLMLSKPGPSPALFSA